MSLEWPREWSRTCNGSKSMYITAFVGHRRYADLEAVYISRTREQVPIYTLGSADPRDFVRPKCTYAGTLIFKKFYHPEPVHTFDICIRPLDEYGKFKEGDCLDITGVKILVEGQDWNPMNMYETGVQYTYLANEGSAWSW